MITPPTLGDAEYQLLRYKIIKAAEAEELAPYIDDEGFPTIGPGFLLWDIGDGSQAFVRNAVYRTLGFKFERGTGVSAQEVTIERGYMDELTAIFSVRREGSPKFPLELALDIIDVMYRRSIDTRLSFSTRDSFSFDSANDNNGDNLEMKEALGRFIGDKEGALDRRLGLPARLQFSRERAALVSLVYHNGRNISREFAEAFRSGDRAEAWYQLRYNPVWLAAKHSNTRDGYYKRLFHAAAVFGLYDNVPGSKGARLELF